MNRAQILSSMFDSTGYGLEIGPSYSPIVPKSSGARIETIDHTDQAGLVQKYLNAPNVDVSRIEPVDYVSDGRSMADIIGRSRCYDFIVASHVIEHTPNMLGFLNDCASLLKENGRLVLAVPDKRYCFDTFRPTTSTGDVLQAFYENRTRHTPGAMFDHIAYVARRGGASTWSLSSDASFQFVHSVDHAMTWFERLKNEVEYIDCHAWQFTPASFRLILHDLATVGLLQLREQDFHDTVRFEFFVGLSPSGPGCPLSRIELVERAQLDGTRLTATGANSEVFPELLVPGHAPAAAFTRQPAATLPEPPKRPKPLRNVRKKLKRLGRAFRG